MGKNRKIIDEWFDGVKHTKKNIKIFRDMHCFVSLYEKYGKLKVEPRIINGDVTNFIGTKAISKWSLYKAHDLQLDIFKV